MTIDWSLVAIIGAPLLALVVGAALDRFLERRPKIIFYLGHVSAFTIRGQNPTDVYTHSVVVANAGKRSAKNVKVEHNFLPNNYNVYPQVDYTVNQPPEGGAEIVFPTIVPGEQVTISYLYFPPVTWAQVNRNVKHDQGFGQVINVLPQRQYPQWFTRIVVVLMWFGLVALIYVLVVLVQWIASVI